MIELAFSTKPKNIKPFENLRFAKKKSLKLIKDFNFNLGPKQFSFQTDMDIKGLNKIQMHDDIYNKIMDTL